MSEQAIDSRPLKSYTVVIEHLVKGRKKLTSSVQKAASFSEAVRKAKAGKIRARSLLTAPAVEEVASST